jgi:hypothetical protein
MMTDDWRITMAGETLTNLDGILKDIYEPVVTEEMSLFDPIAEQFEDITEFEFDGRQARESAIMSLNEGVGGVPEGGALPTPGAFDPQQFAIKMTYVYGTFQMTKPMMESAKSSKGAFKNAMSFSMDSLIRNMKREKARMLWSGGLGIIALINGTATSTTQTFDAPGGIAGTVGGTRYIRKGMHLAGINPSGPAFRVDLGTVASVAATGLTAVFGASTTGTDNDYVVHANAASSAALGDTAYANEPVGLLGLVDDGTFLGTLFGLSRTTYPQLNSRVQTGVGALSLDAIQLNFDIADQLGDADISVLACHHAVRRAYLQLLEADRRYTDGALTKPDGGTVVAKKRSSKAYITFGGVDMVESKYAPYDMLFGLDKRYFKHYVQIKGEWADDSGAILRQVGNTDVWSAFYRIFEQYHCSRPNTNFRMSGITTSKVYVPGY